MPINYQADVADAEPPPSGTRPRTLIRRGRTDIQDNTITSDKSQSLSAAPSHSRQTLVKPHAKTQAVAHTAPSCTTIVLQPTVSSKSTICQRPSRRTTTECAQEQGGGREAVADTGKMPVLQ